MRSKLASLGSCRNRSSVTARSRRNSSISRSNSSWAISKLLPVSTSACRSILRALSNWLGLAVKVRELQMGVGVLRVRLDLLHQRGRLARMAVGGHAFPLEGGLIGRRLLLRLRRGGFPANDRLVLPLGDRRTRRQIFSLSLRFQIIGDRLAHQLPEGDRLVEVAPLLVKPGERPIDAAGHGNGWAESVRASRGRDRTNRCASKDCAIIR